MTAVTDPDGTCHLVGCAGKGTRDHHVLGTTIGAPSDETWQATSQPQRPEGHVVITYAMADRVRVLLEVLAMRGQMERCHITEARILGRDVRKALGLGSAGAASGPAVLSTEPEATPVALPTPSPVTRLEHARAEITRRRALARAATVGPWRHWNDGHVGSAHPDARLGGLLRPTMPADDDHRQRLTDAQYVAANDPAHVLAVLAAADATLDRHVDFYGYCGRCNGDDGPEQTWPCPDAATVLDLYAPEAVGA